AVSALRFFFGVTLERADAQTGMTTVREPRRLSVILSPEEVARLLDAASGLKAKAALSGSHGAGLRASEVVSLKVTDIDSSRQAIRVSRPPSSAKGLPSSSRYSGPWFRVAAMRKSKAPLGCMKAVTVAGPRPQAARPSRPARAVAAVRRLVVDITEKCFSKWLRCRRRRHESV
ncbi:MAG: hypothetical protein RH942_11055, partial [Kiloniellaceae bacterium]